MSDALIRAQGAERSAEAALTQVKSDAERINTLKEHVEDQSKAIDLVSKNSIEDYQKLSKEVSILEKRNRLALLGDKAIADASRQAFDEIEGFIKKGTDSDLVTAAKSESAKVISFWALMTRIRGVSITHTLPDGTKKKDGDISTPQLIEVLSNKDWQARATAARLLGERKNKRIPEALLQSARKDESLEVRKYAIAAFRSVTGCECPSVLSVLRIDTLCSQRL